MITGKKGFSWGVAAAVLLASAACTHKKSGGGQAASDAEGGSGSPVAVQFTQGADGAGSGAGGSAGLALADVSGRTDFGGTLAVTSYNIDLFCGGNQYKLQGGRMIVRTGETACASTLTSITVADQHGLIASFASGAVDVAAGESPKIMDYSGPDIHQSEMKLLLSGKALDNGTDAAYTFTVKNIAAGDNTTGVNNGDSGAASSVTVAGVALPDVEPTQASAWTSVVGGVNSYRASVKANGTDPCGINASFAVELFAQAKVGLSPADDTAELVASGQPGSNTSGTEYQLNAEGVGTALIDDCKGKATNLYLKLSCTDNAVAPAHKGTSYKIVSIKTHIPSSPYEGQGEANSYRCENSAVDGFNWDASLTQLDISDVFEAPAQATPAAIQSSGALANLNQATCEALASSIAGATYPGFTYDPTMLQLVAWSSTDQECQIQSQEVSSPFPPFPLVYIAHYDSAAWLVFDSTFNGTFGIDPGNSGQGVLGNNYPISIPNFTFHTEAGTFPDPFGPPRPDVSYFSHFTYTATAQ